MWIRCGNTNKPIHTCVRRWQLAVDHRAEGSGDQNPVEEPQESVTERGIHRTAVPFTLSTAEMAFWVDDRQPMHTSLRDMIMK